MLNTILFQSPEAFFSYKTLGPKKMFIKNIMLYVPVMNTKNTLFD